MQRKETCFPFVYHCDLRSLHSPSIITGDNFHPDFVPVSPDNLEVNAELKRAKYEFLMETLKSRYTDVKFVNLSLSSLRIFGLSCSSFIEMCSTLAVDMERRR